MPIDVGRLEKFDPMGVPTVTELLAEIDDWNAQRGNEGAGGDDEEARRLQDYEKTGLKPYVDYFKAHVAGILKQEQGVKREREDGDPMEF